MTTYSKITPCLRNKEVTLHTDEINHLSFVNLTAHKNVKGKPCSEHQYFNPPEFPFQNFYRKIRVDKGDNVPRKKL